MYRKAAETPDRALCCVPQPPQYLPGLVVPPIMHEMNYGCGSTVHLQDMRADQTVLYVGVGGGLEALQFAYFTRRPGGVVAIDPVPEMREVARRNLEQAARLNDWFDPGFVEIREGDALDLPVDDGEINLAIPFLDAEPKSDTDKVRYLCLRAGLFLSRGRIAEARRDLDQPHRLADGGVERAQPAVRQHQHQRGADAERSEALVEVGQVGRHHRLHVRVGAGGGEPLVLANLGTRLR